MNSVGIDVEGLEVLRAQILKLADDKDKRKEIYLTPSQVARPTLAVAKKKVPIASKKHIARGIKISPGNLKNSLGLIRGKNKQNPTILVGPRVKGKNMGWYGHMVHGGHNIYNNVHKSGASKFKRFRNKRRPEVLRLDKTGTAQRVKGNPFLTSAYQETQGKVTADAVVRFTKFVQRRINKLSS